MRHALLALLLATSASAVTPEVHRDLFYTEAKDKLQSLDVYSPPEGKDHPIIVWIHGGGWSKGDKAAMQQKPQAFVDRELPTRARRDRERHHGRSREIRALGA
jgi:arylformamidase